MNYDQMKNGNLKLLQSTQNGSYIPTRIPTVLLHVNQIIFSTVMLLHFRFAIA